MKILNDLIKIQASDYNEDGDKLEPEEKPAERIMPITAPVNTNLTGQYLGQMKASINVQGTVNDFAKSVRFICAGCKFFSQRDFRRWRDAAEFSPSKQRAAELEDMKLGLLAEFGEMSEQELEQTMASMGVCRILTEIRKDPTFVHPECGCPEEYKSATQPEGFYAPLSLDTEKIASSAYDQIMRHATGE